VDVVELLSCVIPAVDVVAELIPSSNAKAPRLSTTPWTLLAVGILTFGVTFTFAPFVIGLIVMFYHLHKAPIYPDDI
jgi:hypothetical protein